MKYNKIHVLRTKIRVLCVNHVKEEIPLVFSIPGPGAPSGDDVTPFQMGCSGSACVPGELQSEAWGCGGRCTHLWGHPRPRAAVMRVLQHSLLQPQQGPRHGQPGAERSAQGAAFACGHSSSYTGKRARCVLTAPSPWSRPGMAGTPRRTATPCTGQAARRVAHPPARGGVRGARPRWTRSVRACRPPTPISRP